MKKILAGLIISTLIATMAASQEKVSDKQDEVQEGKRYINGMSMELFYSGADGLNGFQCVLLGPANVRETANGMQASLPVSIAGEMNGFQFSLVNVSKGETNGFQLGLVNYSKKSGTQLGLINVIKDGYIPFIPIFNVSY